MNLVTRILATFFGTGYFPVWPATLASAFAVIFAWFMPETGLLWMFGILTVAGFWACAPAVRVFGSKDPQKFVMDEVCGMFLSVLFLPKTAAVYAAGFVLFRLFDACKPWPISLIQKNDHPLAIVWDDLAAGVAANLVLQAAVRTVLQPGGPL